MLSFASSLADDVLGTDLDDQSDPYVVNLVKQLLDQCDQAFILVYALTENQPLDNVLSLVNHVLNNDDKVHLAVLSGEHETLERLLMPLEEKFIRNSDDDLIRKMIRHFVRG